MHEYTNSPMHVYVPMYLAFKLHRDFDMNYYTWEEMMLVACDYIYIYRCSGLYLGHNNVLYYALVYVVYCWPILCRLYILIHGSMYAM